MISTSYSRFGGGLRQACGQFWWPLSALRASEKIEYRFIERPESQHSITLTARPPREVSLYLSFMSAPVSRIVLITLSSDTKWVPSPRKAIRAALIAFTEPIALR